MIFWLLGLSCKGNINMLSANKVSMTNVLLNSCLLTHPVDTEQHYHSFRGMFLTNIQYSLSFLLCFGVHQLLSKPSGYLNPQCSQAIVAVFVHPPFGQVYGNNDNECYTKTILFIDEPTEVLSAAQIAYSEFHYSSLFIHQSTCNPHVSCTLNCFQQKRSKNPQYTTCSAPKSRQTQLVTSW